MYELLIQTAPIAASIVVVGLSVWATIRRREFPLRWAAVLLSFPPILTSVFVWMASCSYHASTAGPSTGRLVEIALKQLVTGMTVAAALVGIVSCVWYLDWPRLPFGQPVSVVLGVLGAAFVTWSGWMATTWLGSALLVPFIALLLFPTVRRDVIWVNLAAVVAATTAIWVMPAIQARAVEIQVHEYTDWCDLAPYSMDLRHQVGMTASAMVSLVASTVLVASRRIGFSVPNKWALAVAFLACPIAMLGSLAVGVTSWARTEALMLSHHEVLPTVVNCDDADTDKLWYSLVVDADTGEIHDGIVAFPWKIEHGDDSLVGSTQQPAVDRIVSRLRKLNEECETSGCVASDTPLLIVRRDVDVDELKVLVYGLADTELGPAQVHFAVATVEGLPSVKSVPLSTLSTKENGVSLQDVID